MSALSDLIAAAERVCGDAEQHEEQWAASDYDRYPPLREAITAAETTLSAPEIPEGAAGRRGTPRDRLTPDEKGDPVDRGIGTPDVPSGARVDWSSALHSRLAELVAVQDSAPALSGTPDHEEYWSAREAAQRLLDKIEEENHG